VMHMLHHASFVRNYQENLLEEKKGKILLDVLSDESGPQVSFSACSFCGQMVMAHGHSSISYTDQASGLIRNAHDMCYYQFLAGELSIIAKCGGSDGSVA